MTQSSPSEAYGPRVILSCLWAGKWIIMACTLLTAVTSAYYAKTNITPIYRATTKVMIETQQEQVVGLDSVLGGLGASDSLAINSEVEVLRSYELLDKVVDMLDLTSDPEFNRRLNPPTQGQEIRRSILSVVGLADTRPSTPDAATIRTETMLRLRSAVQARNLSSTLIFNISANSVDRQKAALISRTLANLYIDNQLEVKYNATQRATRWLTARVTELQTDLEAANAAVTDFRSAAELTSRESLLAQERQLKDTRDRITRLREVLTSNDTQISRMQAAQTFAEKAASAPDGRLQAMLTSIETPATQKRFDGLFALQLAQRENERTQTLQKIETLQVGLQRFELQNEQMNDDLILLEQLSREAEATRLLYEHFLTRLKETAAQEGIQRADSRILSAALVPKFPISPNTKLIVTMWGILGVIAGIGIVMIQRLLRVSVMSHSELEAFTGEIVMGQIPRLNTKTRAEFLQYLVDKPTSQIAEAVRNLRTSVSLSNIDQEPRVVALTSSLPGEGKTSLSLALGHNISLTGKSCLLIDGDIRRQMLKSVTNEDDVREGLMAILTKNASLQEVVIKNHVSGCDLLLAENHDTSSGDVFASEAFGELIKQARKTYDYVIIDTPPVLLVPDSRIITQHIDALLFIVAWNRTSKQQVQNALQIFADYNQRVTGLVLNQINNRAMRRMGYGSDYERYASNYYHK